MTKKPPAEVSRRAFLASLGVLTAGVGLTAVAGCGNGGTTGTGATTPAGTGTETTGPGTTAGQSTGGNTDAPAVTGGTVTIGMASVSSYLNPLTSTNSAINWVTDPVVETLYAFDDSLDSVPLLADGEPTISADGLTWTIKLKQGVKFSNGDPFDSSHVVAVLDFVSNPKSTSDWTNYFGYRTKSIKAVDAATVQIVLLAPYGIMREHLTNLPMVHKAYVQKTDTTVGTGPFKISANVQGQSVTLGRNADYHGQAASLETVKFISVPDPGTRLVNLRQGTIDVMTDVPPDNVAELEKDANILTQVVSAPHDILTYFVANKPPFDNVKVRQALAWAMDRAGVNDLVYADTAIIAQGPLGPATEGYDPNAAHYPDTPDIEKAKALIAESGVSDVSFKVMIINTQQDISNLAQVLVEGWQKAGINATLDAVDGGTWVNNWLKGNYQLALSTYDSGIGGGKTAFVQLSNFASTNPLNFGYKNPQVDALLFKAWSTSDAKERIEACTQADALVAADAIGIPPVYPKFIVAQRKDVSPVDEKQMSISRIKAGELKRLS